ncbi:MAG: S9 family peptidase [Deltaproteobacteria bacterium]|nr:S9 family peptidase [Deltaproteobacteria bacterium]
MRLTTKAAVLGCSLIGSLALGQANKPGAPDERSWITGEGFHPTGTHPFDVRDMWEMERLADVQVAPAGDRIAFVVGSTDFVGNKGQYDIWSVRLDGREHRRLTTHPAADQCPRWSPDGKTLYFLSMRSGSSQIWRIDTGGGEAVQVTAFAIEVEDFVLAPDGRFVVALSVYPDCKDLGCTVRRDEVLAKRLASGKLFNRLFVRRWDTWSDGKRRHLFVWQQGASGKAAEPRDLMTGVDADCPSKPWGGVEELAIAPDSKWLVYSARVAGREEAWSTDHNLYRVSLDGSQKAQCLTCANKAWDTQPAFSPDGSTVAYLAMTRPGYESDQFKLRLLDVRSGKMRTLAEGWDRSASGLVWSKDGKTLFTTAENLGQVSIYSVDVTTGSVKTLVEQGTNDMPKLAADRLVFLQDTLIAPDEIFSVKLDGSDLRAVTHVNAERLKSIKLGAPEQFSFVGAKGDKVYGYLVKPVDFNSRSKYPIALLVHGGPQGSFGNHWHYRWNPQIYAGAGYAAVAIDFHGSTGYGQKFQDAIRDDWGGAPYEDLIKGLDAAIARYGFLDGRRSCALGASYGAYMIYWMAGQTDRFRCLVAHDGNLDEKYAYFATDELWFPEWEHRGTPWENPDGYSKHNPVDHVAKWKTPMLVVHGALDFRVVDTGGLGAFNALQRRGIPSRLLYYPDENHWVLKPANSYLWHKTVLGWLSQYLRR